MVEHEGQQGQAYDLRVGGEVGGDQGYTYGQRFLRGCVEHGDRVFAGEAEQPGPPIGDQEEKDPTKLYDMLDNASAKMKSLLN